MKDTEKVELPILTLNSTTLRRLVPSGDPQDLADLLTARVEVYNGVFKNNKIIPDGVIMVDEEKLEVELEIPNESSNQ
jgi:hypothetical protein